MFKTFLLAFHWFDRIRSDLIKRVVNLCRTFLGHYFFNKLKFIRIHSFFSVYFLLTITHDWARHWIQWRAGIEALLRQYRTYHKIYVVEFYSKESLWTTSENLKFLLPIFNANQSFVCSDCPLFFVMFICSLGQQYMSWTVLHPSFQLHLFCLLVCLKMVTKIFVVN